MKKILSIFMVVLRFPVECRQQKEEKMVTTTDDKKQAITIKHAEWEINLDKPAKKVAVCNANISCFRRPSTISISFTLITTLYPILYSLYIRMSTFVS
ncbi:hypothetical protein J4052_02355 [Bacillus toyonensis]|nr:hypothetical protein [Bacillus toyonensis]